MPVFAEDEEVKGEAADTGEEIFLETQLNFIEPSQENPEDEDIIQLPHEKTLAEKLKEVYNIEIERTDVAIPLSNEITTMHFVEVVPCLAGVTSR